MERKSRVREVNRKFVERHSQTLLWLLPLCIAILGACLAGGSREKEQEEQREIAAGILRFHVLANSDSREDQERKLRVRDAVIRELRPHLEGSSSKAETKQIIREQMEQIEETALRAAAPESVRVSLAKDWFPQKTYGDCTFPEGEYDALRIELGEAKGHNWWCVLYPELCFSVAMKPVVTEEGKEELEGILDEGAMELVRHPVRVRWRWVVRLTQPE